MFGYWGKKKPLIIYFITQEWLPKLVIHDNQNMSPYEDADTRPAGFAFQSYPEEIIKDIYEKIQLQGFYFLVGFFKVVEKLES